MAKSSSSKPAQLLILDPGHFHASLVQKQMYADVDPHVSVVAPLGPELIDYLNRISLFNNRSENPTTWELDIRCSSRRIEEMLAEAPGNVVVIAGKNRTKMDRIAAAVSRGFNVLADKPWILSTADLPKLEETLRLAETRGLVAYDIMTERYEVTSELQRELVNAPDVFGELDPGTAEDPGIRAHSVHNIMKIVSGLPLRRPAWFFDIEIQGEALADVGTHVVDLVQWTAFPSQVIDHTKDISLRKAARWALLMTRDQFQIVSGESNFPTSLQKYVSGNEFDYFCNNSVEYTLRGIHVSLEVTWEWQAPEGAGDIYEATFRGTRARAEIRQGRAENYLPELYIVPIRESLRDGVFSALRQEVAALQSRWPGLGIFETPYEARIVIPQSFRVGHEAHFAQVTNRFFEYLRAPESLPSWERPNMLAKYHVATKGVEIAQ